MSSAKRLPRCPHRVATRNFKAVLGMLLLSLVSFSTVTELLHGRELLDFRLVDPASHMQPWPEDQSDILIEAPEVVRIASKWRTNLTGSARNKKDSKKPETQTDTPKPTIPATPQNEAPVATQEPEATAPTELEVKETDLAPASPVRPEAEPVAEPLPPEPLQPEVTDPQPIEEEAAQPQTTVIETIEVPASPAEQLSSGKPTPEVKAIDCYRAPPLTNLTTSIALPGGELPANAAALCAEQNPPTSDPRLCGGWNGTNYHWSATCMHHRPLYFEEINAERYGYTVSYALQPVISAARFFAAIPALPYKMVVERPRECIHTLGHYRPGSCAPRRCNRPGWSLGASAVETGAIAGLILLIP